MALDPLSMMAPIPRSAPELPRPGTSDKEAAKAFEAYLVGFLASQMRSSVKGGPLNEGAAGMFADLFDQHNVHGHRLHGGSPMRRLDRDCQRA